MAPPIKLPWHFYAASLFITRFFFFFFCTATLRKTSNVFSVKTAYKLQSIELGKLKSHRGAVRRDSCDLSESFSKAIISVVPLLPPTGRKSFPHLAIIHIRRGLNIWGSALGYLEKESLQLFKIAMTSETKLNRVFTIVRETGHKVVCVQILCLHVLISQ